MTSTNWAALPLLPMILQIFTWNVRGLGSLKQSGKEGCKLLTDFRTLGPYDILLLQEHKLFRDEVDFISMRLGVVDGVWSPAQGNRYGGLAILLGERYAGRVVASGMDEENAFIWAKLDMAAAEIGIVNAYAPHSPEERALVWQRMQDTLESGVPWLLAGDFNFVERRKD